MNCQKCNSPLNEGDKFCQVCGSIVENNAPAVQPQPVEEPAVATPEVAPAPVEVAQPTPEVVPTPVPVADAPMMAQPMNQPMPGPVPMAQPQPAAPMQQAPNAPAQPAKKNNTIVIVLVVLIVGLIIALVVLLATSGKDDNNNGGNNNGNNGTVEKTDDDDDEETPPTPVDTSTKTIVKQYTFLLPEGYYAAEEDDSVIVFDENDQVQATVESMDALFSQVSAEKVKTNLEGLGVTGITTNTITKNNKKLLVVGGTYKGARLEFIYIEHAPGKIVGSVAIFIDYNAHKDTIYDIFTKITIAENGYSNSTNFEKPGITLQDAIK